MKKTATKSLNVETQLHVVWIFSSSIIKCRGFKKKNTLWAWMPLIVICSPKRVKAALKMHLKFWLFVCIYGWEGVAPLLESALTGCIEAAFPFTHWGHTLRRTHTHVHTRDESFSSFRFSLSFSTFLFCLDHWALLFLCPWLWAPLAKSADRFWEQQLKKTTKTTRKGTISNIPKGEMQ